MTNGNTSMSLQLDTNQHCRRPTPRRTSRPGLQHLGAAQAKPCLMPCLRELPLKHSPKKHSSSSFWNLVLCKCLNLTQAPERKSTNPAIVDFAPKSSVAHLMQLPRNLFFWCAFFSFRGDVVKTSWSIQCISKLLERFLLGRISVTLSENCCKPWNRGWVRVLLC